MYELLSCESVATFILEDYSFTDDSNFNPRMVQQNEGGSYFNPDANTDAFYKPLTAQCTHGRRINVTMDMISEKNSTVHIWLNEEGVKQMNKK